jgi:hypothetical protein
MSDDRPLELLKLVSGESIVGRIEAPTKNIIRVHDPLSFETGAATEDMSKRYIYMCRLTPFLKEQVVDIDVGKIVFHGTPSDSIARYYKASLAFCERRSDVDFEACLNETSVQMEEVVGQMDMENAVLNAPLNKEGGLENMTQQVFQNLLLAAMPTSNTIN